VKQEQINSVDLEVKQNDTTHQYSGSVSKHALLSPSGCERWSKCPAAPSKSKKMPNNSSYAATRGTIVHEISEMELKDKIEGISLEDYWLGKEIEYDGFTVTVEQDMIDAAKSYVEYVRSRQQELDAVMLVEEQYDCNEINSNIWGTADITLLSKDRIVIIDLKAGKWAVDAEDNLQLKIYGLMALSRYSDRKTVEWVIVQPLAKHREGTIRSREISSENLTNWGFDWLKPKAEACLAEDPVFLAGKHCHFCNYKSECETHNQYIEEKKR